MTENTVRTVIIFSIIGLALIGVTVGGVKFLKARNTQYAGQGTQQTTQKPAAPQTQQSSGSNPVVAGNTPAPSPSSAPTTSTPAPSAQTSPASQPQPSTTTTPAPSSVAATGPRGLPATGPADVFGTAVGLVAIVFGGLQLVRSRLSFRRYIEQS